MTRAPAGCYTYTKRLSALLQSLATYYYKLKCLLFKLSWDSYIMSMFNVCLMPASLPFPSMRHDFIVIQIFNAM